MKFEYMGMKLKKEHSFIFVMVVSKIVVKELCVVLFAENKIKNKKKREKI